MNAIYIKDYHEYLEIGVTYLYKSIQLTGSPIIPTGPSAPFSPGCP